MNCNFCGKLPEEVRKLIQGPNVYICDGCIELCNDILAIDIMLLKESRYVKLNKLPDTVSTEIYDRCIGRVFAVGDIELVIGEGESIFVDLDCVSLGFEE